MLSIAVSTISNRIEKMSLLPYEGVQYVIVHQEPDEVSSTYLESLINRSDVIYVPLMEKGLSVSRNVALEHADGDYVMIMDDDVTFSIVDIYTLLSRVKEDDVDVATYYHRYTNGNSTLRHKRTFWHNKFNIANPSSIDICVKRSSILKAHLKFDELFGLGSQYPSGEEMIFLSDCLDNRLLVKRYPIEICTHPPITSGVDFFSTQQKVNAKRAMFSRVYPKVGGLIFMLFVVKKFPIAWRAGYGLIFISNAIDSLVNK
nr:glycosyltransferase [Shewanella sp. NKUCC06_TVS]